MADLPLRRKLLMGLGASVFAAALDGCATGLDRRSGQATAAPRLVLPRIQASSDLINRITVCTRPFRAEGPRIEMESIGSSMVVHNYGHGGSGWSLSWGSSALAVDLAMTTGQRDVGVIGCGALGITSAILLQRAGARVTIYAKELPPNVRSSLATGVWSPDSRICLEPFATPAFRQRWETMARKSFDTYQTLIGLPNNPIEFFDNYYIQDPERPHRREVEATDPRPKFAELERELLADIQPKSEQFEPGTHAFGNRTLSRRPLMMYNINTYQRMLMAEFQGNGGRIEVREFQSPAEFSSLPQKTLIHATGYGARALLGDLSITPVRGQLARMAPQPGINYGIFYNGVVFIPRRDGFVFQVIGDSDYYGYGDDTTVPSRPEAELAVGTIRGLFADA